MMAMVLAALQFPSQAQAETSTITFGSDGGTPIAPITQDEGTPVVATADPTWAGYTFMGWVPAVQARRPS